MIKSNNGEVLIHGNGVEIISDYMILLTCLIYDISEKIHCTKAEALISLQEFTLDSLDIILN